MRVRLSLRVPMTCRTFRGAFARAGKSVTWHNDDMHRAALAFALVACGARTDLGGTRGDGGFLDASHDVSTPDAAADVSPSKCPAVDYIDDTEGSTVFAIDDTRIYFVNDPCAVTALTKDGVPILTFTMGADCAGEIVVDDHDVYWTSAAGHLMRHAKDGSGGASDLGCAALDGCPGNVHVRAVAKDVVVLVDGFRPVAMPKVAGLPYPLMPSGFAPPAPVHYVFVDDTRAYWNTDIRVFSSALDGSTLPLEYATASIGLAINSTEVYWTANAQGNLLVLDSSSKDGSKLGGLSNSDTSTPLVANDAFVYGVSPVGITRQPTSGAPPTAIVLKVHPLTLALDDSCVYFAEKTDTGRRIARAPN